MISFSMKTLLISFIFLIASTVLFSQEPKFDLKRSLKFDDPSEIKEKATAFIAQTNRSSTTLYLQAITESDAPKAVDKYIELFTKYPDSQKADEATFRVAQYYFSRGLYIAARKYFLGLVKKYPESEFVDDSQYLATACLVAARKLELAEAELRTFLAQNRSSPYARIAKEDLKEVKSSSRSGPYIRKIRNAGGKFTLQIGAFSRINNALNLRNKFSKLGHSVEIREKKSSGVTIYQVLVGLFETRKSAEKFGKKLEKQYGTPYRIIVKE